MASGKRRPVCLGTNVLKYYCDSVHKGMHLGLSIFSQCSTIEKSMVISSFCGWPGLVVGPQVKRCYVGRSPKRSISCPHWLTYNMVPLITACHAGHHIRHDVGASWEHLTDATLPSGWNTLKTESFPDANFVVTCGLWCCQCPLQWRHNERDTVSNHQPHHCLLNRLFRRKSKKTSKLCGTGLCEGNSTVTGEFPAQRSSNAENISI